MARDRDPENAMLTRAVAGALVKLGEAALNAGAAQSARAAFHESAAIRLHFADTAPDDRRAAYALAVALERLGLAALACGDRNAARGAWEEELMLAERLFANDDSIEGIRFRAIVHAHLADVGGAHGEDHRTQSMALFDILAKAGVITEREAALRKKLWGG
ncbi:MAG: hypothetical protein DCF16_14010 [Alphaproteobacteria bacterium]|nr:MAG: hypothetical protein DCF16_14010 [Alphaproteobacteria bacterium]